MELSLYEAHKIIKRITKLVDDRYQSNYQYNVYSQMDSEQWLLECQAATINRINLNHELVDVRYALRRLIQTANEENGINELICEEKRIRSQLHVSTDVISRSKNNIQIDAATLKRQADAVAESNGDAFSAREHISVFSIPAEIIAGEKENVRGFEKLLDDISVKLNNLNHNTRIQIPTKMYELLQTHTLI